MIGELHFDTSSLNSWSVTELKRGIKDLSDYISSEKKLLHKKIEDLQKGILKEVDGKGATESIDVMEYLHIVLLKAIEKGLHEDTESNSQLNLIREVRDRIIKVNQNEGLSPVDDLPSDLVGEILGNLSIKDKKSVALTNKKLNIVSPPIK